MVSKVVGQTKVSIEQFEGQYWLIVLHPKYGYLWPSYKTKHYGESHFSFPKTLYDKMSSKLIDILIKYGGYQNMSHEAQNLVQDFIYNRITFNQLLGLLPTVKRLNWWDEPKSVLEYQRMKNKPKSRNIESISADELLYRHMMFDH